MLASGNGEKQRREALSMSNTRINHDRQALIELRTDFPGHRIFRGTRGDGQPGSWVATLRDPACGVDPTVMADTAEDLRKALKIEASRATVPGAKR
ncbi:hypothetical protein GCM10010191_51610 [Actinomadura vinacea]|uniref:Uncharacterized protein n=1 Tax=Actinomadura vinacea TaxID=115336 RepID=A0ABP5WR77_9ACTN